MPSLNRTQKVAVFVTATTVAAVALVWANHAKAADLGGNCCADLEERIAELEATVAKKGNRKVSLTVYGQVNKGLMFWDAKDIDYDYSLKANGTTVYSGSGTLKDTGNSGQSVIDNGVDPSFVGFAGRAAIGSGVEAGYAIEIGVGGYTEGGALGSDTNDLYVQRSFFWLKSNSVGAISVGKISQATDDLDKMTVANTDMVIRPLSLRPLTGPEALESLDLFDGNRANGVRYDTPTIAGFVASASWAPGDENDAWDVALRYAGEFSGFKVLAGAGYRHGIVVNGWGSTGVVDNDFLDLDTWTLTASTMHVKSGLFIGGTYGRGDGDLLAGLTSLFNVNGIDAKTTGWQINGGIEQRWFAVGKTTLFGEYGDVSADADWNDTFRNYTVSANGSLGYTYWGFGAVQSVNDAALDLYANVRFYQFDAGLGASVTDGVDTLSGDIGASQDATVGMVGARIRF